MFPGGWPIEATFESNGHGRWLDSVRCDMLLLDSGPPARAAWHRMYWLVDDKTCDGMCRPRVYGQRGTKMIFAGSNPGHFAQKPDA